MEDCELEQILNCVKKDGPAGLKKLTAKLISQKRPIPSAHQSKLDYFFHDRETVRELIKEDNARRELSDNDMAAFYKWGRDLINVYSAIHFSLEYIDQISIKEFKELCDCFTELSNHIKKDFDQWGPYNPDAVLYNLLEKIEEKSTGMDYHR